MWVWRIYILLYVPWHSSLDNVFVWVGAVLPTTLTEEGCHLLLPGINVLGVWWFSPCSLNSLQSPKLALEANWQLWIVWVCICLPVCGPAMKWVLCVPCRMTASARMGSSWPLWPWQQVHGKRINGWMLFFVYFIYLFIHKPFLREEN